MRHNKGIGRLHHALCLHFVVCFFLLSPSAGLCSNSDAAYQAELIQRSKGMGLSADRYWAILLHYEQGWAEYRSLVDDPQFFLSPEGKRNPGAEMEATIRSFFQDERPGEEHPRCRFIARYQWLKDKLGVDESRLPAVTCTKYAETIGKIRPESAVLVFPGTYLNNPSSMFGHTFIKINVGYESKLLAHAVNYSAYTGNSHGLTYAVKGLLGFYPGYYSIMPYYEKVKEYSDIDERDMWEYTLNLSPEEVRKMLWHIWELKDIYSDYYFFDENCSYNILFLIESARPAVHLTDRFGFWVIPIDTVRAVKEAGLVQTTDYRPSKSTKIRYLISHLNDEGQDLALRIVRREADPGAVLHSAMTDPDKMAILDLSAEFVQHRYLRNELSKQEYSDRFLAVLKARSQLQTPADFQDGIPAPVQPDDGHASNRLSIAAGWHEQYRYFQEIQYRPAYHDLSDDDRGYVEGSQIKFAETTLRYYDNRNTLWLENLDIIDIVSISPMDRFFSPISWRVNTGLYREGFRDKTESLVFQVSPGGGFAYKVPHLGTAYIFGETELDGSGRYDENYAAGLGGSAGLLKKITDNWRMNFRMRWLDFVLGDIHHTANIECSQGITISRNNAIRIDLSESRTYGYWNGEWKVAWNHFF